MRFEFFTDLPDCAREIRKKVFIDEQGFTEEFDGIDAKAVHMVIFDENTPTATCRIFRDDEKDYYLIGRIAVIKEYRGRHLGAAILKEAESYIKANGGKRIVIHAQQRVVGFYKKSGFEVFGGIDYDEGCPHIYLEKYI